MNKNNFPCVDCDHQCPEYLYNDYSDYDEYCLSLQIDNCRKKEVENRLLMKNKTFTEWLMENQEPDNMCPPPLDPQLALDFLTKYLLGDDWYVSMPISTTQCNTEIVFAILQKYSKEFKKELKTARG